MLSVCRMHRRRHRQCGVPPSMRMHEMSAAAGGDNVDALQFSTAKPYVLCTSCAGRRFATIAPSPPLARMLSRGSASTMWPAM